MRLWSLHPRYLDPKGLVALWREGLLAQKVLLGQTKGYRNHPQLNRFRAAPDPTAAIGTYLREVMKEAAARGYCFDASKIVNETPVSGLIVTSGQIAYEWQHLQEKLMLRCQQMHDKNRAVDLPEPHPMFIVVHGGIEEWERM